MGKVGWDTIQGVIKRRATQVLFGVGVLLTLSTGFFFVRGFWRRDEFRVSRMIEKEGTIDEWRLSFEGDRQLLQLSLYWKRYPTHLAVGWPTWRDRRKRTRQSRGLCPACAYDLRGAAHERCPECGEPVAAATPV